MEAVTKFQTPKKKKKKKKEMMINKVRVAILGDNTIFNISKYASIASITFAHEQFIN